MTHDPEAIWESQLTVARAVLAEAGVSARDVAAIGIANQRETTILWERATGRPVADAIVWQSRITAPFCAEVRARGLESLFRRRTGLPLDAYFSGPKIRHILNAEPDLRRRAERGEIAFGTVDAFLLWRLTGGRVHATDVPNASRRHVAHDGRDRGPLDARSPVRSRHAARRARAPLRRVAAGGRAGPRLGDRRSRARIRQIPWRHCRRTIGPGGSAGRADLVMMMRRRATDPGGQDHR